MLSFKFSHIPTNKLSSLLKRWTESHRCWHDIEHLMVLLLCIDATDFLDDSDKQMLYYVALFHDIVYNPAADDNEEKSVILAARHLKYDRLGEVVSAILSTKTHKSKQPLEQLFNSWDCAILKCPQWEDILNWEEAIAAEFCFLDKLKYTVERIKFLEQASKDYDNPLLLQLAKKIRENENQ